METKFADFSPGEVSDITGIHPDTLRTWRKRGAVPSHGGARVRFSPFEVGGFMIQHQLAKLGMSPVESKIYGDEHGARAVFVALMEGKLCEASGPQDFVDEVCLQAGDHTFYSNLTGFGGAFPDVWFLVEPDGRSILVNELKTYDLEGIAACYLLNLMELGIQIAQRAPRPLVQLRWTGEASDNSLLVTVRV